MKLPLKKPPEIVELSKKQIDILFNFTRLGKKDIFYDLGSGRGNLVIRAYSKYNVKRSIGFEIEKSLYEISTKKLLKFSKKIPVEFFHVDYENFDSDDRYVYDISDATVIFNSLQPTEDELVFYQTQFRGKRNVTILKKDLPLVGYVPSNVNRIDDHFWFFMHKTPLNSLRTKSKKRWAEVILQKKNARISDVYDYFDRQLKKRGFRKNSRKELIGELKPEIKKFLPNK